VTIRRIGEPVQVDPEALGLLTSAGVVPGARVDVTRDGARVVVVRDGGEPSTGVSLPDDVAVHVYCQTA
ncbi:MAG: ferrous iron transport protein A, partial [Dermatophilaceae bacterium]|nr:ferrous iron transport protein A [Dermatophilaceae bacterium]